MKGSVAFFLTPVRTIVVIDDLIPEYLPQHYTGMAFF
jgi:hypothetical protein